MLHAALSLLAAMVARLSPAGRARLGRAIGHVAGSVLRIRRALVEAAMARAGVGDPAGTADRMYGALGVGVTELLWLAWAPADARDAAVGGVELDPAADAALAEALERGPVVLFASHTANWELAAAAAARRLTAWGRRLAVVAKPMSARGVHAFVAALRERLGVLVLAPRGAFAGARAVLDRGDVLVMPIDQVPERARHGVEVQFLGAAAMADRAPATVAWRSRATALVVAAERLSPSGRIRVVLLDRIDPPDGCGPSRAWIDGATARATAALERFVRRSPESWLWLHRRWRLPHRADRGAAALVPTREPG